MIAAGRAFLTLAIIPQAAAGPFWAAGPRSPFTEPPPGEDDRLCAQYANAEPPASDQPTPASAKPMPIATGRRCCAASASRATQCAPGLRRAAESPGGLVADARR